MPDPRRVNSRRYRLSLLLTLLCLGLLSGARTLSDVVRSVQLLRHREKNHWRRDAQWGEDAPRFN